MNTEKKSFEKSDVYQKVTDQIVAAIEAGLTGKWQMPWNAAACRPINTASRKPYRGINTLCLLAAAQSKGYASAEWGTYKQWQEKGAQVRKGEKATLVVFWKFSANAKESEDGDGDEVMSYGSKLIFTRGYSVFNAAQVAMENGDAYVESTESTVTREQRIECAEGFFAALGAEVRTGGDQAYYMRSTDHIQMPAFGAFVDGVAYYSTLAHECTHWTAKADRCDREMGKRFGDMAYAAEELVAELGAVFISAHLGIESTPREDHAKYVDNWLKVLKADKRAIFTAASKAQKAADFMIGRVASKKVEAA